MELTPYQLGWAKAERERLEEKIEDILSGDDRTGIYRLAMRSESLRVIIKLSEIEQAHNVIQPSELPDI